MRLAFHFAGVAAGLSVAVYATVMVDWRLYLAGALTTLGCWYLLNDEAQA